MSAFDHYLDDAWNKHGDDAKGVAESFISCISLVNSNEELQSLVQLMGHVYGEHLGLWTVGSLVLSQLKDKLPFEINISSIQSIDRFLSVFKL